MIKAILLDIDNTLLDFDAYVQQAMAQGFSEYKLGVYDQSVYQVFLEINSGLWRALEKGELTYEQLLKIRWNKIFSALGISFDGEVFEGYFKGRLFHTAIPVDGAMELLEHLQGKYILAVASNGPYEQQMNRLKLGRMAGYFSHFFISEQMGVAKPAQAFFDHCLFEINRGREEKILPGEVMMIGDSLTSDMAGAIAYGLKTCWFDKHSTGDPGDLAPDYRVTGLFELQTLLERSQEL